MLKLRALAFCVCAAIALSLELATALAGGTISLDEVMDQLRSDGKLIAEIKAELKKQNLKAGTVICTGSRFGNHWPYLVGLRAVPYECEVGTRKLSIDGELIFYDKAGKALGALGEAMPEDAARFKTTNVTWTWS